MVAWHGERDETYMALVKTRSNTAPLLNCHRDGCGLVLSIVEEQAVEVGYFGRLVGKWVRGG